MIIHTQFDVYLNSEDFVIEVERQGNDMRFVANELISSTTYVVTQYTSSDQFQFYRDSYIQAVQQNIPYLDFDK